MRAAARRLSPVGYTKKYEHLADTTFAAFEVGPDLIVITGAVISRFLRGKSFVLFVHQAPGDRQARAVTVFGHLPNKALPREGERETTKKNLRDLAHVQYRARLDLGISEEEQIYVETAIKSPTNRGTAVCRSRR